MLSYQALFITKLDSFGSFSCISYITDSSKTRLEKTRKDIKATPFQRGGGCAGTILII